VDKGLQAAGVCANLLIEMNTIQGYSLLSGRQNSYGSPALRLQEGRIYAVKLTAPTLRRSMGLLWNATIDVLLLVPSQQLPPVLLENGLTLAGLSTREKMKEARTSGRIEFRLKAPAQVDLEKLV